MRAIRGVAVNAPAASGQLTSVPDGTWDDAQTGTGVAVDYLGCSLSETGGTNPVVVTIYNSTTGAGNIVETLRIPAGGDRQISRAAGVDCPNGLYVAISGTGVLSGSIHVAEPF